MASTVQSTASAPLPEAPQRPSPARGPGRNDDFGARLDEAASLREHGGEAARPRAAAFRDPDRARPDRARTAGRDDARPDARKTDGAARADEDGASAPKSASGRPARTGRKEPGQHEPAGQERVAGTEDQPPPSGPPLQATAPDGVPAARTTGGESKPVDTEAAQDQPLKAGEEEPGEADAAPAPADPALSALLAVLGDIPKAEPAPPAAAAPAPAAVAMLQPVPPQPVDSQPTPAAQDDGAALAGVGPAGAKAAPTAAPRPAAAHPEAMTSPARPATGGTDGSADPATPEGGRDGAEVARGDQPAKATAPLPDLRLPGGTGKAGPEARVNPPQAASQPQPTPEALPAGQPADAASAAGSKAAGETAKEDVARTGTAGESKGASAAQGTEKASSAQGAHRDLQVTAFSLDPAPAAPGAVHAAGLHRDTQGAAQVPASTGPQAPPASAVPVQAVPIEIGMRVLEGAQQFTVRLHPEDLGRVDVRIGIDDDGKVTAQLVVDKVETLAMLQRDARTLERAFDQAGLKTSEGSLQFTLNTGAGQQQAWSGGDDRQRQQTNVPNGATKIEPPEDLMAAIRRVQEGPGGLDIRI